MAEKEIRCPNCDALLAKETDSGIVIRRSGLHAALDGTTRASFTCYRCGGHVTIEFEVARPANDNKE